MVERVTAREYHERTKHSPQKLRRSDFSLDFSNKPTPYETYHDLPSVELADRVRPSQMPTLAAIADSEREKKSERDPEPESGRNLDLDALTQLCYYSAGVTKKLHRGGRDILFRAAACTGALYHVDLFLVVGDCVGPTTQRVGGGETVDLAGLDAGVYHFDPRTLSLDVLREGDYRRVLAEATGREENVADAPVSFVTTSTWWRNAWKYRERTYRHAFWDSGTILANLLGVARALDLPASVVAGFADEEVAALLGADVDRKAPLEIVPVGAGNPVGSGGGGTDVQTVEPIDPETEPLSRDEKEYDLIQAAYRGSALDSGTAARAWRERRPKRSGGEKRSGVGTRPPGDGARVALDPVDDERAAKTPLHWTIRRRGSCREYARETLNLRKVSTVLDRGVSGFPADFRDPDGPALQFNDCYLLVHDVAGVAPGAYQFHPEEGDLELLREGNVRDDAARLALGQRLAGDAGLCAFFLTDLDAVVEQSGDRGYRAAQLEASLTAGKLYLGAYAHSDLGATGLTFHDDLVTEFFEPRAEGQTPTFLWTMGRPAK